MKELEFNFEDFQIMAPTPSRTSIRAFSVMCDGTLRMNEKLRKALGAKYLSVSIAPDRTVIALKKVDADTEKACAVTHSGTVHSNELMLTLQDAKYNIPARFNVYETRDGVCLCKHDPTYKFAHPKPSKKQMSKPRKEGLGSML